MYQFKGMGLIPTDYSDCFTTVLKGALPAWGLHYCPARSCYLLITQPAEAGRGVVEWKRHTDGPLFIAKTVPSKNVD